MTIRQKLFLILGLSQVGLLLILFITFSILIQSIKNEPQNKRALELTGIFEKELSDREEFLKTILTEFLENDEAKNFFKKNSKNRNLLVSKEIKFIKRFRETYKLNIMEIGDEYGKVIFRFHRPSDFGDNKSNQPIIKNALEHKQISSTLEIGHSGVGLRAAAPIPGGGTLLIGQVIDDEFASKITKSKDVKIAFFKKNQALAFSDPILKNIFSEKKPDSFENQNRYEYNKQKYFVSKIPYESNGLSNQKIHFVVFIDETLLLDKINKVWLFFGLIALIIFSIILSISYLFSKNIIMAIKKLNFAMKNIENKELENSLDLKRNDEIGEMGKVFISMKDEILTYQGNLVNMVEEKTKELNHSLTEIKKLKEYQDGDYYLTSLLIKPLSTGNLKTDSIKIETITKQKKKFNFRNKESEIGGDLCIAESIKLNDNDFTVFLNADAMGKSIQGAGGALVLGTVFKSIISRTKQEDLYKKKSPERWLKDCFKELQNVFISFDGSMLISAIFGLVDNESGIMYYINAEHPWMVLYRDNKAEFIKTENYIHKIGLKGLDNFIQINTFQLKHEDNIILGSDGRDDILKTTKYGKEMNEDENEFLKRVEESEGDLLKIENSLHNFGELTDDLTLMRLTYKHLHSKLTKSFFPVYNKDLIEAENFYRKGNLEEAIYRFEKYYENNQDNVFIIKKLAKSYIKDKQYKLAAFYCLKYTNLKPSDSKFLYYTSFVLKQVNDLNNSIEYGERFRLRFPGFIPNLINLTEVYILNNKNSKAYKLLDQIANLDPDNKKLKVLKEYLKNSNKTQSLIFEKEESLLSI